MTKYTRIHLPLRAAAIAVALSSLGPTASHAGNAGASLPDCYNHVITACNGTAHPDSCAEAGMNACDDYHAANGAMGALDRIRILVGGGDRPTYRAILQTEFPRPNDPARGRDQDDDDDRGSEQTAVLGTPTHQPQQSAAAAGMN